jgi:hypothetical protein
LACQLCRVFPRVFAGTNTWGVEESVERCNWQDSLRPFGRRSRIGAGIDQGHGSLRAVGGDRVAQGYAGGAMF